MRPRTVQNILAGVLMSGTCQAFAAAVPPGSAPVPVSTPAPVVVHNPWLVNDRVADTHNIGTMAATYVNAYTPDGVILPTTDEQKAINIYNNQKRRLYHWGEVPPNLGGTTVGDPTYTQNVFGWALCGRHASMACTIANAAGFPTIFTSLPGHNIYQVQYDGRWHMYDTMCTCYVYNRQTPPWVAGCDEIKADPTLMLMATAGRACPGFLLCGDTADWYANAVSHWSNGGSGVVPAVWNGNMDLRTGQSFTRTWESWANQHPPYYKTPPYHHEARNDAADYVNFPYWEPYRLTSEEATAIKVPDQTYRRWADGTDTLAPDFRGATYQALLEPASTGLATYNDDGLTPDLHTASVGTITEAIFKVNVPFYITDANFSGDFVKTNTNDLCSVQFSADGTNWSTVWSASNTGTTHVTNQSLRSSVFGRWTTYYIKIQLRSTVAVTDAGVSNFALTTIFEHNKGAMAYLDKGTNHVTLTFDNPADLQASGNAVYVVYKWKEFDGTDWTIDRQFSACVTDSPATFTIDTFGTKVPRTESILMDIAPPDDVPPAPITDLTVGSITNRTALLRWTASGDDDVAGTAIRYEVRRSTSPITDMASFNAAQQMAAMTLPKASGSPEQYTVTGLAADTTYYFAVAAYDKGNNSSGVSNNVSATTLATDAPPAPILDLAAPVAGIQTDSVLLTWTATGEDDNIGAASYYRMRYSTAPITDMQSFESAGPVTDLPTPALAGTTETFRVPRLVPDITWYFAIIAYDAADQPSGLSNVAVVTTTPHVVKVGDINDDGYVNVADLQALAAAWASDDTSQQANWNPAADLNTDGYINIGDLQILLNHWNQ